MIAGQQSRPGRPVQVALLVCLGGPFVVGVQFDTDRSGGRIRVGLLSPGPPDMDQWRMRRWVRGSRDQQCVARILLGVSELRM